MSNGLRCRKATRSSLSVAIGMMLVSGLTTLGCGPPSQPADQGDPSDTPATVEQDVPAAPGVGKQGQIVGDGKGYMTTVAATLFKTRQRVIFEIQIPQALQLYEALHGHKPKTEEAFFDEIIRANNLKLPELPEGDTYFYDPEQGQLMVRQRVRE